MPVRDRTGDGVRIESAQPRSSDRVQRRVQLEQVRGLHAVPPDARLSVGATPRRSVADVAATWVPHDQRADSAEGCWWGQTAIKWLLDDLLADSQ